MKRQKNELETSLNLNKEWLNSKEAAEYLSISPENLRVKISKGEIRVNGRLGRTLRFRREELDKLLVASSIGGIND